ncbi:MAG: hypothetical protein K2X55_15375 [Burkholderiaceae bacterium]|nr:hypothetical protein [Burkholderiaceae bacterium]
MKYPDICGAFNNACRHLHIRLLATQHMVAASPEQLRLMRISAALTFGGLVMASPAHAVTTTGVASLVSTFKSQVASIKTDLGVIFAGLGFGGAGYGGINWIKKGREGEHSQVKASQIFIPILAGAALGSMGFVMLTAGETAGIGKASHGSVPGAAS